MWHLFTVIILSIFFFVFRIDILGLANLTYYLHELYMYVPYTILYYSLGDPESHKAWEKQCGEMAHRLSEIRHILYDELVKYNVKGEWSHVIAQHGYVNVI
jgi:hypothetical protein